MLKKTCALGGLVVATAAGALITTSSASATVPAWGGWHHNALRLWSGHRSFNANENALFNRIRIRIRNRNNNVAINNQAQRQREHQFQTQRFTDFDGLGVGAPVVGAPAVGAPALAAAPAGR